MSEKRQVALMFAPYAFGALLLFIIPALYSLSLSLYDADLLTESRFIGLGNFVELAGDEIFHEVLWRSALFVLIPLQAGMKIEDLSRVLQGITAGIGFLGAGAILKQNSKGDIRGLTTAASVWLTAAVGIAAGMGREGTAVVSAVFALVILAILRPLSKS